jgi:hypothetical protein
MINEEIVGGLVSALSRGEPLEKAMMTFFNAGYKKEEIEGSAKEVYNQLGPQAMGVKGSLQDTIDEIALKAGVPKDDNANKPKPNPNINADKIQLQTSSDKKAPNLNISNPNKDKNKIPQNFSHYGQPNLSTQYQNADDITNKIVDAIKGLKQVNIPSRIEIVQRSIDPKPSTIIQKVSDYSGAPQKTVSKAATYVLIVVLILLLGALAAVFFFKADLIKFFNNAGLG